MKKNPLSEKQLGKRPIVQSHAQPRVEQGPPPKKTQVIAPQVEESTLMDQIKEAQKGHESIEGIKKKMSLDKAPGFAEDVEGVLRFNGQIGRASCRERV